MNNFVGTIPSEFGGLKNLISLDLFHNNLTGFIPPSLSKLSNVRFMDVSNNDLCGTFPTWGSFSKLTEESFMNNPRLEGPELMGSVGYDDRDGN
ncbi:putative non-specific serine/threonine protein kinase [Helianthus annuus]|nr:putative non-specific serine/threonine protein kinase [Helianthus annuus]